MTDKDTVKFTVPSDDKEEYAAVFSGLCTKPSPKKATTPSTRSSATC